MGPCEGHASPSGQGSRQKQPRGTTGFRVSGLGPSLKDLAAALQLPGGIAGKGPPVASGRRQRARPCPRRSKGTVVWFPVPELSGSFPRGLGLEQSPEAESLHQNQVLWALLGLAPWRNRRQQVLDLENCKTPSDLSLPACWPRHCLFLPRRPACCRDSEPLEDSSLPCLPESPPPRTVPGTK